MSGLGQSRRSGGPPTTSGLPRRADKFRASWHFAFVPIGDIWQRLRSDASSAWSEQWSARDPASGVMLLLVSICQTWATFQLRQLSPNPSHPLSVTATVSSSLMNPRFGCRIAVSIEITMPLSSGRSSSVAG